MQAPSAPKGKRKPPAMVALALLIKRDIPFLTQVFAIAAETGWREERILFMPLARLFQYKHCLLRRNRVPASWSGTGEGGTSLRAQLKVLRTQWSGELGS